MLAVSFFTIVFSTLLWLIASLRYIHDSLAGISFFNAGITNTLAYMLLVCLPVFLLWVIFGYINQYLHNKNVNIQLYKLFGQMKKNQDYSDLLARVMIETESQVKDGFMLNRFDLLIGDMNELLSEIIHTTGLASSEQIERLWSKVQNGGKWSFGKVVIEVNNAQADFQRRVYEKALHNLLLGGTIMEFCARYQSMVAMLEKHDKDKVFLDIIETGVMGRVFSIFAPVADEIRKNREASFGSQEETSFRSPQPSTRPAMRAPRFEESAPKESLIGKIFKKKPSISEPIASTEPDPFSMALERSFGTSEPVGETMEFTANGSELPRFDEPQFEISLPHEEPSAEQLVASPGQEKAEPVEEMTATQKQLNSLKKEWADIGLEEEPRVKTVSQNEETEENLAYPFGGWTDEQNYRK